MASTATPAGDDPILETRNLQKTFGEFTAVDHVDLAVEPGEFRSVIGPNGAGKTTLFDLITGAQPVTGGEVSFYGQDITGLPPEQRVERGIGRSFQIINVFDGLTAHENVRVAAQAVHTPDHSFVESLFSPTETFEDVNRVVDRILAQIGLEHAAETTAGALPYGEKRRLEIGVVLATDPELVLLDEPAAGMSVEDTQQTIELIQELLADQTLLLIEHDVELVMSLSDRITVLNQGQVIAEGTPDEIATDQTVQDAYLGGMVE